MKIGIIGGGSLGLMWTARLMAGKINPLLIVRSEAQRDLLLKEGLHYERGDLVGEDWQTLYPSVVTSSERLEDEFDLLILTVKQTQLDGVLPYLDLLPNKGLLLTLQNGYGHIERLTEVYPPEKILIGVTTDGALRTSPNSVKGTGYGGTFIGTVVRNEQVGNKHTTGSDQQIRLITDYLNQLGFQLRWDTNILERIWKKLLINSVINPLTALLEIRNGQLLDSPSIIQIMQQLYYESKQVANGAGINLSDETWQEIKDVCRITSQNHSSMLQDLLAGRPLELDYINGYLLQKGREQGVIPKTHELIMGLLKGKEEIRGQEAVKVRG